MDLGTRYGFPHQPQWKSSMTTKTTARGHMAELIELKEATAHMLIETRYAASIHHAHACEANTEGEFMPFIYDCGIKVDKPTTGTKPCK